VLGKKKTVDNLDKVAIGLVQEVVKETGAVLCLCSDWRLYWDIHQLGKELNLPILFKTPYYEGSKRGYEVQHVVEGYQPSVYVVLDDTPDFLDSQQEFYVKVDSDNGVSYKNYEDMVRILNGEEERQYSPKDKQQDRNGSDVSLSRV
jgi:hypothetical protein